MYAGHGAWSRIPLCIKASPKGRIYLARFLVVLAREVNTRANKYDSVLNTSSRRTGQLSDAADFAISFLSRNSLSPEWDAHCQVLPATSARCLGATSTSCTDAGTIPHNLFASVQETVDVASQDR